VTHASLHSQWPRPSKVSVSQRPDVSRVSVNLVACLIADTGDDLFDPYAGETLWEFSWLIFIRFFKVCQTAQPKFEDILPMGNYEA